jgi:hypothetical protein
MFVCELLCLFVNDGGSFYFFYLVLYDHEKHKNYKNLVSMPIHGGLTFRV